MCEVNLYLRILLVRILYVDGKAICCCLRNASNNKDAGGNEKTQEIIILARKTVIKFCVIGERKAEISNSQ